LQELNSAEEFAQIIERLGNREDLQIQPRNVLTMRRFADALREVRLLPERIDTRRAAGEPHDPPISRIVIATAVERGAAGESRGGPSPA
jgi:PIN domain nuclease of toxin-antitoxin system